MAAKIDWVLFDWGNVLVEYRPLGFSKLARALGTDLERLTEVAMSSGMFDELTVGTLSADQLIEQLRQRYGVTLTRAQIVELFRGDVELELPGIRPLIAELKARGTCRLAILSNVFFGHWDSFESTELYREFELPLASHLIGAAKPSRAAFEIALRRMGTEPERVVFIDDKRENVEGARALGIHAFVTDSVATTRAGLSRLLGFS